MTPRKFKSTEIIRIIPIANNSFAKVVAHPEPARRNWKRCFPNLVGVRRVTILTVGTPRPASTTLWQYLRKNKKPNGSMDVVGPVLQALRELPVFGRPAQACSCGYHPQDDLDAIRHAATQPHPASTSGDMAALRGELDRTYACLEQMTDDRDRIRRRYELVRGAVCNTPEGAARWERAEKLAVQDSVIDLT